MTLLTTIAFVIACFMLFACLVHLLGILWGALVYVDDKLNYDGRIFWDKPEEEPITADTLETMKTHTTTIEIIDAAERTES